MLGDAGIRRLGMLIHTLGPMIGLLGIGWWVGLEKQLQAASAT